MSIAIYPGSFNPWHKGNQSVLDKALKLFDKVIVAKYVEDLQVKYESSGKVYDIEFNCLLTDLIADRFNNSISAVIRGLRNGNDLQYEQNIQYWYEDLGLKIPIVYLICDREHVHISSSSIREVRKFNV
jgi:pantetheine-phosphate adenylyltransferase